MSPRMALTVFPLNIGGSNACRLELEAIFGAPYFAASYGINRTSSPKQADMILLHGSGTVKAAPDVYRLLAALPIEVKLVALGSECATGVPFKGAYGQAGPIREAEIGEEFNFTRLILPPGKKINAYIGGSPPDPQTIIEGIIAAALT